MDNKIILQELLYMQFRQKEYRKLMHNISFCTGLKACKWTRAIYVAVLIEKSVAPLHGIVWTYIWLEYEPNTSGLALFTLNSHPPLTWVILILHVLSVDSTPKMQTSRPTIQIALALQTENLATRSKHFVISERTRNMYKKPRIIKKNSGHRTIYFLHRAL